MISDEMAQRIKSAVDKSLNDGFGSEMMGDMPHYIGEAILAALRVYENERGSSPYDREA